VEQHCRVDSILGMTVHYIILCRVTSLSMGPGFCEEILWIPRGISLHSASYYC